MMLIIDSSYNLQLAFVGNKHVSSFINTSEDKSSDIIVQKALLLLSEAGLSFEDIKCLSVVTGPGLFTGIRTGVLFANMLSYLLKKKIISINVFEILSLEAFQAHNNIDLVLSTLNIGKKGAACALLDRSLESQITERYVSELEINDFIHDILKQYQDRKIIIVGNKHNILHSNINNTDLYNNVINSVSINYPKLSYAIEISQNKYKKGYFESKTLVPFYVGDPSTQI